jgi:glycosyltransferase involved in cell wall biosynthesis
VLSHSTNENNTKKTKDLTSKIIKEKFVLRILVLSKRQYMRKDLLDDRFGRFREIPLALAQKGHNVQGLCLSYRPKTAGLFHDGPVSWRSINATRLMLPGLIRFINKANFYAMSSDVIWACSDSIYGIIGYGLSKKHNIPIVFDLYDNFESFLMARLPVFKQLYRHVVVNCDAVTCVSRPLETLVSAYGRKKRTIIIDNAVRKDLFFPFNKEKCREKLKLAQDVWLVGTAGALTSNRGIKILFDAFNILKNKYPRLHLAVSGPRDISIPRDERIHDLGVLPFERVPIFLNALDVGIVCNLETAFGKYCFPQKTRELMACNIPIVAANVGSMKDVFTEHPEWLFDPNKVQSLVKVLENRFDDRTTHYGSPPTWGDLAQILEKIMLQTKKRE